VELAAEAAVLVAALRGGAVGPPGEVLATGEAAQLLGVSSVGTIKR
jgi:hypothetical protein